jgi:hypothetical protein
MYLEERGTVTTANYLLELNHAVDGPHQHNVSYTTSIYARGHFLARRECGYQKNVT